MVLSHQNNIINSLDWHQGMKLPCSQLSKVVLHKTKLFSSFSTMLNCCILLPISKNVTLLNVVAMVTKILDPSRENRALFKTQ
jgi:hypothetical protein